VSYNSLLEDRVVTIDETRLTREAELFHRQFFRHNPSHRFVEQYLKVHAEQPELMHATDNEFRTVQIIVEKELNAFGIEPWLRSDSRRHLLSRKLLLTSYLTECGAMHPQFRQEVEGRARSFFQLCQSVALAAILLVRGKLHKGLYGLL